MGGVVVESGKFPWDNGNFPQMTEPSRGYHGVRFYETFGDFGFTMKARMETMRTLGPTLSPLAAFLLMQGIETLHVRMPRHCESALAVAKHLAAHPAVDWVSYPALPGGRYESLARRYLPRGAGGILTFGVKAGGAARPARSSSNRCSSFRISRTSATRRRSSSIRPRPRTASSPKTSSARPASRRR